MNYFTKFITSEKHLFTKLHEYSQKNVIPILDYAIENNKTIHDVKLYCEKKKQLLKKFPMSTHSLKLSSIGLNYEKYQDLVNEANDQGCTYLIDAEDYTIQNTIDLYTNRIILNNESNNQGINIFKTYQMYRKDSMEYLTDDLEMFSKLNLQHNIKLVRGAYILNDNKYGVIWNSKKQTDDNYNRAVELLLSYSKTNPKANVIFATHNPTSIDIFQERTQQNIYHAVLMGMDHHLRFNDENYKINRMVHIPFGPLHKTYPYMFRRLQENNVLVDNVISLLNRYKKSDSNEYQLI